MPPENTLNFLERQPGPLLGQSSEERAREEMDVRIRDGQVAPRRLDQFVRLLRLLARYSLARGFDYVRCNQAVLLKQAIRRPRLGVRVLYESRKQKSNFVLSLNSSGSRPLISAFYFLLSALCLKGFGAVNHRRENSHEFGGFSFKGLR